MTTEISNVDDVIDSRDVIARIAELEAEREAFLESEPPSESPEKAEALWLDTDEGRELATLKALESEAEGSPDWRYGETLIRDSYFEDYAQQLAEDCGMIPDNLAWPVSCIDWEQAARELQKMDYSAVDFDGVTYWIRS